jgi:hypothetical protein
MKFVGTIDCPVSFNDIVERIPLFVVVCKKMCSDMPSNPATTATLISLTSDSRIWNGAHHTITPRILEWTVRPSAGADETTTEDDVTSARSTLRLEEAFHNLILYEETFTLPTVHQDEAEA